MVTLGIAPAFSQTTTLENKQQFLFALMGTSLQHCRVTHSLLSIDPIVA